MLENFMKAYTIHAPGMLRYKRPITSARLKLGALIIELSSDNHITIIKTTRDRVVATDPARLEIPVRDFGFMVFIMLTTCRDSGG